VRICPNLLRGRGGGETLRISDFLSCSLFELLRGRGGGGGGSSAMEGNYAAKTSSPS